MVVFSEEDARALRRAWRGDCEGVGARAELGAELGEVVSVELELFAGEVGVSVGGAAFAEGERKRRPERALPRAPVRAPETDSSKKKTKASDAHPRAQERENGMCLWARLGLARLRPRRGAARGARSLGGARAAAPKRRRACRARAPRACVLFSLFSVTRSFPVRFGLLESFPRTRAIRGSRVHDLLSSPL